MSMKLTTLTFAILAGLALPALADRGSDGPRDGRLPMARPSFAQMDVNNDGKLTPEELAGAREAGFAATDTDGDGELSADEMTAAAVTRMSDGLAMRTERMMERMDADGNGTLSLAELSAPRPRMGGERMFERLDTDKDGALSESELAAMEAHGRPHGDRGGKHHKDH